MPIPITPRTYMIILVATATKEVASFMINVSDQLIIEAQSRAINFAIQYGAMAVGQCAVGSKFVDPTAPGKLFVKGFESLTTASTPEEAASRGTVAAAVLILSSLSSKDPNASLTFGGFLIVLIQQVLLPGSGSQVFLFSTGPFKIYVICRILMRVVTEIRVERLRKKLKLPRARFNFKLFKKEKPRGLVFKYPRLKKRKLKILSREISLPIIYEKELIIKATVMVKPITI